MRDADISYAPGWPGVEPRWTSSAKSGVGTSELILALNVGSSSVKLSVFEATGTVRRTLVGALDRMGTAEATLQTTSGDPPVTASEKVHAPEPAAAVALLVSWVERGFREAPLAAIVHRVVHGGPTHARPVRLTQAVLDELRLLSPFDPEHLPQELLLADGLLERFPTVPQIACFDTAFHHDLPRMARLLPIPRRYERQGLRRYGFHGISYAFLLEELERLAGATTARGRVILAHLGHGASIAAVCEGRSVDTTMSFTPTAGIPMGTRSGDLDPGLLLYLARTEKLDPERISRLVNAESGLLGMSETSSDMRDLLDREAHDIRAGEAISVFCYQIKKAIGGFSVALGGVDTLVFSGGIGERAAAVRARICEGLSVLGIRLDADRNARNAAVISSDDSRTVVRVIPTDEERWMAEATCRLLNLS